jgi:hypothetical protein
MQLTTETTVCNNYTRCTASRPQAQARLTGPNLDIFRGPHPCTAHGVRDIQDSYKTTIPYRCARYTRLLQDHNTVPRHNAPALAATCAHHTRNRPLPCVGDMALVPAPHAVHLTCQSQGSCTPCSACPSASTSDLPHPRCRRRVRQGQAPNLHHKHVISACIPPLQLRHILIVLASRRVQGEVEQKQQFQLQPVELGKRNPGNLCACVRESRQAGHMKWKAQVFVLRSRPGMREGRLGGGKGR